MLNGTRPRRDDFASDLQRWHADLLACIQLRGIATCDLAALLELPERNVRRRIGA